MDASIVISGVLTDIRKVRGKTDTVSVHVRTPDRNTVRDVYINDGLPLQKGDRITGVFTVEEGHRINAMPIAALPGDDMYATTTAMKEALGRFGFGPDRVQDLYRGLVNWGLPMPSVMDKLSNYAIGFNLALAGEKDTYLRNWPMLTEKQAEYFLRWWYRNQVAHPFLLLGIPKRQAWVLVGMATQDTYPDLYAKARDTPYRLPAIPIEVADQINQRFGRTVDENSTERRLGVLSRHVYEQVGDSVGLPIQNLNTPFPDLTELAQNPSFREYGLEVAPFMIYPRPRWEAEVRVSKALRSLLNRPAFIQDTEELRSQLRAQSPHLTEEQHTAVVGCLTNSIALLTGAAGTGKTTTIKAIVELARQQDLTPVVCSFTGKAVMRLQQEGLRESRTIHRILFNGLGIPEHITERILIVVDEASMVSLDLLSSLIKHLHRKRIRNFMMVLVGDPAQLPPIDYGDPFSRLTAPDSPIPHFRLTTVKRTEGEGILINAQKVRAGISVGGGIALCSAPGFDLLPGADTEQVVELYLKHCQAHGIHRVLLLTPFNADRQALNQVLRERLNPDIGSATVRGGDDQELRVGDFVMITKNSAELELWNGSEGYISHINSSHLTLELGRKRELRNPITRQIPLDLTEPLNVSHLIHAYCTTVHKAQGSEAEVVIFYCPRSSAFVNRNLVYTALTRAKFQLFLVGDVNGVRRTCRIRYPVRHSRLIERITAAPTTQ